MSVNHGLLAHHFDTLEHQRSAEALGMWAFLATEVMVFGTVLTGYFAFRLWYPEDWEAVSSKLNVLIGGVNTVVLLTSSLTMALSVHAVRVGRRRMLLTCLILTALLGTVFMGFKGLEYYGDYLEGLVPGMDTFKPEEWTRGGTHPIGADRAKLFLMFYYIMTGLHAVHLTIGIGLIAGLAWAAHRGSFSTEHYMPIEISGLYWHFVDIVWIFLLPLLYLIGTHNPHELHLL